MRHSETHEHAGIKAGDTVEVARESGMPGERAPRLEKVRRIVLTEATEEEQHRLHIPAVEVLWQFESGKTAGHYDQVHLAMAQPKEFSDKWLDELVDAARLASPDRSDIHDDVFYRLARDRMPGLIGHLRQTKQMLSQLNGMYEKLMAPLRKLCRVTEDESPWGCLDRLVEERTKIRSAVELRIKKGHNSWCATMMLTPSPCNCGHQALVDAMKGE